MKKIVAAAAVTGLLAGGAAYASAAQAAPTKAAPKAAVAAPAAPAADASSSFTPKAIKWTKCGIKGLDDRGGQCGYLIVPLDYKKPTGTKIKLAVSRIKSSRRLGHRPSAIPGPDATRQSPAAARREVTAGTAG